MENKKKILLINTSFYPRIGGVENSLVHLINEYKKNGDEVTVVCGDIVDDTGHRYPKHDRMFGAEIVRFKMWPFKLYWLTCFFLFLRLKIKNSFDAVISRSHVTTILGALTGFKVIYLVPGIASLHEKAGNSSSSNLRVLYSDFLQKLAFSLCHRVCVFSESMFHQVKRLSPNCSPIKVNAGCDSDRFQPRSRDEELARELEVSASDRVLLCVGRLNRMKSFEKAISVMPELPNDFKLLIVGSGSEERYLLNHAISLGVSDRVKFVGSSKTPERFYSLADFFLFTSIYEPFGQVLLEAAFSGVKVVALDDFYEGENVKTATNEIFESTPNLVRYASTKSELISCILEGWHAPASEFDILRSQFSWGRLSSSLLKLQ
ncbi:UNVERIFIED_ORG: glycosyltransferase involved in cell wall biosynthesis [Idiomarina abyssalis]|uniref:glycosyltransferase family 4 protein n=1 Tax=Idiomarina sp. 017G TaxID=2183988 RepID=UPI000E0EBA08|nr:glycosyltransferase family 4 protein [Idiomarina sp. 017G]TDO50235.1 glycosyltransferase involved in cell wall biosynthesis [Idiomarina sp. 017G]